jgi:hypothetical protein
MFYCGQQNVNLIMKMSHLVRFPGNLVAHVEIKEKCGNFTSARDIATRTFGVYEGKSRSCLYWPPDAGQGRR